MPVVAIVKPDWGITGGFERVIGLVERLLTQEGMQVRRVEVPVGQAPRDPFGVPVPPHLWGGAQEWFTHFALLEQFRSLDVSFADVVISTQPPSYAVRHPAHVGLFYHHLRAYYDLAQLWVEAGFASAALHEPATALLRQAEAADLAGVGYFLAGSPRVVQRLQEYSAPPPVTGLFDVPAPQVAPSTTDAAGGAIGGTDPGVALCVSRQEFTKRTELFAQAVALAADAPGSSRTEQITGILVGDGGRLPLVRQLAARLGRDRDFRESATPQQLWLNQGHAGPGEPGALPGFLDIRGRVSDAELAAAYRDAYCVVAPAYDEDYGLTAWEAMAHGKPVIVCRDGGGLATSVQDGVNGLVVEPTGAALAQAMRRLREDPQLARDLGERGRELAAELTEQRSRGQLLEAIAAVRDEAATPR